MKSFLPLVVLLISMSSYAAAVYMQTDNNDVTYSDTPVENSQKIDPNNYNNDAVMPTQSQDTSTSTSSVPSPQSEPAPTNTTTGSTVAPQPSTPAPGAAPTTISGEKKEKKLYTLVAIISPADQETIPNQPTIPVTVKTEPDLQQGDKIQLYIDSNPIGDALPSTSLTLPFIERGTHTLSAAVIDKDNKVLKQTDNITIYVQRVNLNTPRSGS